MYKILACTSLDLIQTGALSANPSLRRQGSARHKEPQPHKFQLSLVFLETVFLLGLECTKCTKVPRAGEGASQTG